MLQLRGVVDGVERTIVLDRPETHIGRGDDNDVVMADRVTSLHHAIVFHDAGRWWIRDLESRYGIRVNGDVADEVDLEAGDVITIGTVDFTVELEGAAPEPEPDVEPEAPEPAPRFDTGDLAATQASPMVFDTGDHRPTMDADAPLAIDDRDPPPGAPEVPHDDGDGDDEPDDDALEPEGLVRPIEDFAQSLGIGPAVELAGPLPRVTGEAAVPVEVVDLVDVSASHGYSGLAVGYLTRLSGDLRTAADVDEAAQRTLDIAFAALGVDRGWILFTDDASEVVGQIARIGSRVYHPTGNLPISWTVVRRVLEDRVSVTTGDVTLDAKAASRSMMMHNIRAAMCAPLWTGDEISGVIYVDSLLSEGTFTESALDLLTAMANYLAVAVSSLRNAQAVEHEREARRHLERYHSPAMIEALSRQEAVEGISRLRQADVTVMFADVVGFTSASEELSPDGVAHLLDGFFTEAVEAVFAHGGTLDKFIGDAVMAFFGAPVPAHDHAERALRAALDLRYRLTKWNRRQLEAGGRPVEIRVALNSGPVVVGDVGSSRRVDYTVLGNTVNVAARLEGIGTAGEILVGPGTRERLPADFPLESMGEVDLKGLRHPVPVWRVATRPT